VNRPSAVAVLTVVGLVLVTLSIGLLAGLYGGPLVGLGVGGVAGGIASLVIAWLVEQT
jgi:hypothetical protein